MTYPELITAAPGRRDLERRLNRHSADMDEALARTGAVLLRGFNLDSTTAFHRSVGETLGPLMQYVEGASPRIDLGNNVYTSTEYARELTVAMHNELSYSHRWPARLAFHCRTRASLGGQTPLADSRRVFARLSDAPDLPDAVRYQRLMPPGRGFGVAWPTVFASANRAAVENYCREADIQFAWLPDGSLRTRQTRPTAVVHPGTGEPVWFNQAHQWHPSNSGEEEEAALRALFGDDLPMNIVLPDGREIDRSALDSIRAAYAAEMVAFEWQSGDVLIIDNMLLAHGRFPFLGDREVVVAMGGAVALAEVEQVAR